MSEIVYKREIFVDCIDELRPLFDINFMEIEEYTEDIPLDVDWDRYIELDDLSVLILITARNDGELIGYFMAFVTSHLHHKTVKMCASDVFYIREEYRGGGAGRELLGAAISEMRDMGVVRMVLTHKTAHNLTPLFAQLGFSPFELSHEMRLDK